MSYYKILGFVILCLVAIILFRNLKQEYAVFISAFAGIALILAALSTLSPVISYMKAIGSTNHTSEIFPIIFKSTGVAMITTIGADLCRDSGEAALGARFEMCGKALILSLALPLIKTVFDSCLALLG